MKFSQVILAACIAGSAFTEASIVGKVLGIAVSFLKTVRPIYHNDSSTTVPSPISLAPPPIWQISRKGGSAAKKAGSAAKKGAGGQGVAQHAGSVVSYTAQEHQIHEQQS